MNTIKWGMIGCGGVTEIKSAPAYNLVSGFQMAAVASRTYERAVNYAQRHGIAKVYPCCDELIADPEIDAVYIATPPDSHKEYAFKVLAQRKACCIEKPMATNYADALAINNAFEEAKVPLFVAYYRRSLPRFQTIKQWLERGYIGEVRQLSWLFSKPPNDLDLQGLPNWRTDQAIAPGGYFDDLASHGLDLFNYLLGNIESAKGFANNQQKLYGAFDSVSGCWQHPLGVTGIGQWNFAAGKRTDEVTIVGSQGEIRFAVFLERPLELQSDRINKSITVENPKHIQLYHVRNMAAYFHENTPHPSTGYSAMHVNWVMEQLLGN